MWTIGPAVTQDALERRLCMSTRADVHAPDAGDARLTRPSVHAQATPASGLLDELAQSGLHLFSLRITPCGGQPTARIELPHFDDVPLFLAVLDGIAQAGRDCDLPALILADYPPPVDATMELTTVTPDPAVIGPPRWPACCAAWRRCWLAPTTRCR